MMIHRSSTTSNSSAPINPQDSNPLLLNNNDSNNGPSSQNQQVLELLGKRRKMKQNIGVLGIISFVTLFIFFQPHEMMNPMEEAYFRLLDAMQRDVVCNQSSDLQFVGFWHIGGSNQPTSFSRDDFVKKQLREIQTTHLFNRCNNYNVKLNYVTRVELSPQTKRLLSRDGRVHELPPTNIENMQDDEEYFEFTTLMELYSYCKMLPDEEDPVVFYIHSKTKNLWRLWMENYLMGQPCVDCLSNSTNMACGPSLITDSAYIWQHFSGNFFMTRCQHVRRLNPPYTTTILDEIHSILDVSNNVASGFPHSYPPYGRYAAEYWLMNDAGERPAHGIDARRWPNLRNENEGHHEALINHENTCSRSVPSEIVAAD